MKNEELILRDSWACNEGLEVVESHDTPKGEYSSVVLATLKGPALDYIHDTRNNRGYEEELWDAVANSDYVKELFETRNFLGEPDHPMQWENRADIHYPYVSHAIRELTKRPDNGYYEVVIDILDTPNGRILKTLIDYGVKLGVSSRGAGRTIKKNGRNIVDPRTYRFITIDVVPMPGNKSARMESDVNESTKIQGLLNALNEQIDYLSESNNKDSLKYTKLILDRLEYPECKSLQEKVSGLINEGTDENATSINSNTDLIEAYKLINELRNEITSRDNKINDLTEKLSTATSDQAAKSELSEKYDKAQEIVKSSLMKESQLRVENAELNEKLDEANRNLENLNENVGVLLKTKMVLESQVSELKKRSEEQVLNESANYNSLNENYEQALRDISTLTDQLQYVTKQNEEMTESYFKLRCSQLGLNESVVRNRIGNISSYSASDLSKLITESYKSIAQDRSNVAIPTGLHSYRLNESQKSETKSREQYELDQMRMNVAALRNK